MFCIRTYVKTLLELFVLIYALTPRSGLAYAFQCGMLA